MSEECLICKAPLEYPEKDTMMECVICHKKENSKTRCVNGHFVCSSCHTSGTDEIIALCLNEKSKNPIEILEKMMSMDFQTGDLTIPQEKAMKNLLKQLIR